MAGSPVFIGVDKLLEDIGRGVGIAGRTVAISSKSDVGTLAVKTCDIDVSFELTSSGATASSGGSVDLPLLGAKTITLTSTKQSSVLHNSCRIRLHIVSVFEGAPTGTSVSSPEPDPKPKPGDKPTLNQPKNIAVLPRPAGAPAAPGGTQTPSKADLLAAINKLKASLNLVPPGLRPKATEVLRKAKAAVNQNKLDLAVQLLSQLAASGV